MTLMMILYIIAIIYRDTRANSIEIAGWYQGVSHDQISRMLQSKCQWQTLLWQIFGQKLIGKMTEGYLIVDDTVLEKYGQKMFGVHWVYSSSLKKTLQGINIVMILWTNGVVKVPLGIKVWVKGRHSKIVLASKMLRWTKTLGFKPSYVLFDSWYASKKFLKQIKKYGWFFITRLKCNRSFAGKQLRKHWPYRYGHAIGKISPSIEVLVVKDGSRFLASNDLNLSIQDLKLRYANRQLIEESFKILKFQLAWAKNPSHSQQAQFAHLHLCLMAFCCLDAESAATGLTPYSIRRYLFPGAVPKQSHLIQYFIQPA
jgi:hypothetical protein